MKAEVGDELAVEDPGSPQQSRIGTVVAVEGGDGSPPYLVRWISDYESEIIPGPSDHIEVRHRRRPTTEAGTLRSGVKQDI